ncbi:MAG: helix-turn-helix domain-containing protein [Myxococcota bacterium]
MTQALYDLLGAHRTADAEALRLAYTRAVAQLVRRRKALVDQGGDTRKMDLSRHQVDEAWQVLSDPARRRKYDALVALYEDGELPRGEELWSRVVGSLASPGAASAVDLVRAMTQLQVGQLPAPAATALHDVVPTQGVGAPLHNDTQADVPTEAIPSPEAIARPMPSKPPSILQFRAGQPGEPPSVAPVVASTPAVAPVVQLPVSGAVPGPIDIPTLVSELGWSGALIKRVREARGKSLRDMGDATRISARYLEAIEQDDFVQLPSSTFVKGYLREIARTLQLDEASLIQGYLRRMG